MILLLPLLYHKAVASNQGGYWHLAGKSRDAVDTLLIQCTGQPPRQRVTWPQMSTVPMLSRPAVKETGLQRRSNSSERPQQASGRAGT